MAGLKGMKAYPKDVKLKAVRLFLEEGKTRAEITKMLGLRSGDRVKEWVSLFRHEENAFQKRIGRPRKEAGKEESLEEEVKRLRMENDLLKKFQAELRKMELAERNIGSSNTKDKPTP